MTVGDALPGGGQSALRHLNTRRVLRLLYEGPSLTISGVARETGLSRPTVQGILTSLVESRLLVLDGFDNAPTGGRPAQRYRFAADAGIVAGLDIGAHAVSVRIADLAGAQVAAARAAIHPDLDPAGRIDAAVNLLRRTMPADAPRLWAACAGSPGIIADGVVRLSVAIPDWTGTALAKELTARLDCPVSAVKDANLAVLAEHRVGAAQGVDHVLYVHAGHRLGVGVLVDGRPFGGGRGLPARSAGTRAWAGRWHPASCSPTRGSLPARTPASGSSRRPGGGQARCRGRRRLCAGTRRRSGRHGSRHGPAVGRGGRRHRARG